MIATFAKAVRTSNGNAPVTVGKAARALVRPLVAHGVGVRTTSRDPLDALVAAYLSEVRSVAIVREVCLTWDGSVPEVWTVVDAEPFGFEQREPLHAARLRAKARFPSVRAEFSITNLRAADGDGFDGAPPADAVRVYSR